MKRIILTLVIIFSAIFCIKAQNAHLRFNGVPINGNIFEFESNLDKKDFTQIFVSHDSSSIVLKGTYWNTSNCEIFIIGSELSNLTYAVSVNMPETNQLGETLTKYKSIEDSLTILYGTPIDKIVNDYAVTNANIEKLFLLSLGINKYQTIWRTYNGTISIEIKGKADKNLKRDFLYSRDFDINDYNLNCQIILYFIDRKNKYLRDNQYISKII